MPLCYNLWVMQVLFAVCVVATVLAPGPMQIEVEDETSEAIAEQLQVEVERERGALKTSFRLLTGIPEPFEQALPSGAQVRVSYELRVRARRRYWFDRKVWSGSAAATVTFDPVIGRYRCELILDDVIVASQESDSADKARGWLTAPPPVRLMLEGSKHTLYLRVKIRAVFTSSTKWLVFPAVAGTEWVEVKLEAEP